jgi:phage baseplate assembly protein W
MADVAGYLVDFPDGSSTTATEIIPLVALPEPALSANALAQFGIDFACVDDITPSFTLAAGLKNLGMALARRFSTPRGGLWYDPEYGLDLRQFVDMDVSSAEVNNLPKECAAEARKDERIHDADVRIRFQRRAATMKVTINGLWLDGPYRLVLGVSQLDVKLLEAEAAAP